MPANERQVVITGTGATAAITSNTFETLETNASGRLDVGGVLVYNVDGGFISSKFH